MSRGASSCSAGGGPLAFAVCTGKTLSQALHIYVSRRVLVLRRRGGSSSVSSLAWRSCTTPSRPSA